MRSRFPALALCGVLALSACATVHQQPLAAVPAPATSHVVDSATKYALVVNKRNPMKPLDYVPADLVPVAVPYVSTKPYLRANAAAQAEALFAAFSTETGLQLLSESAYRSYSDQKATFSAYSSRLGDEGAAETTAKPGYSEHQTGLAIDVGAPSSTCAARDCFAGTKQSAWVAANAWRFGFIIRYPAGQELTTGYTYEPWHLRYVGTVLAKRIHGHASSLEAYLGLPAAPDY